MQHLKCCCANATLIGLDQLVLLHCSALCCSAQSGTGQLDNMSRNAETIEMHAYMNALLAAGMLSM